MGNISLWARWTPLPSLTAAPAGLSFGNQMVNTTASAQTVTVSGANLKGSVTYEVTGADASAFTVTEKSWTTTAGGTLDVTFAPAQARTYSANLTIKSTGATSQSVSLSGTGMAAPVAPTITAGLPLMVELGASSTHYDITVTASNATGGYQWHRAGGTSIGGVVDIGAATSSLDVGALGAGQYYVVVYGDGGKTVQSNTCTVTRSADTGTVIVDIQPDPDIPDTSVPDAGALKNTALNDAEKADVQANNVTYTVTLSVAPPTPSADTATTEQGASNDGYTVAAHYDITVDIYRNAVHVRNVTSLSSAVSIVIDIPDELQNPGRTFAMIRVHNGTATVLADTDNSDSTITFASDSFSIYTMVFKDGTDGGGSSGGTTGSTGTAAGGRCAGERSSRTSM